MPGPPLPPGPLQLRRRRPWDFTAPAIGGLPLPPVEIPYEWIASPIVRRPTTPFRSATVSQTGGGTAYATATFPAPGSIAASVTLDSACNADPQNLASHLVTYYASARPRQPTLLFNLLDGKLAETDLATLLGVGLLRRVRIIHTPTGFPLGAANFTVEGIHHVMAVDQRLLEWSTSPLVGAPGGLALPGVPGASASTPDNAALDIVGDIDLRADLAMTSWTTAFTTVISKWNQDGVNQRGYLLQVTDVGAIRLVWSNDGTAVLLAASTAAVAVAAGSRLAIRATLAVNNGAGGNTATFYTAATIAGPWTQLGATVVQAGTTSIFNTNSQAQVSGHSGALPAAADTVAYVVYAVEIRAGINGTVAANPAFNMLADRIVTFADGAGRTWMVNTAAVVRQAGAGPWFRLDSSSPGGFDLIPF